MRLRLLGSSAGKTVPRPFCACRVCAHAKRYGGRDRRSRTGMHLFLDGEGTGVEDGPEPRFQVDLSNDTGHQMLTGGLCLDRLEHLLITHTDADHFDPSYFPIRRSILSDRKDLTPLTVYGNSAVGDALRALRPDLDTGILASLKLTFREVRAFEGFRAGDVEVFPLLGNHGPCTFNYILSHGGRTVLLGWDTGWWADETWEAVQRFKFDAVFMECTVLGPKTLKPGAGHLDFATLLRMRERLIELGCAQPDTPYVLMHIGDNGQLTHDEATEMAAAHGITVGYDGFTVSV